MTPEQMAGNNGAVETGSADALTLMLWPEALLTGTVTAPNGDPLTRIAVLARRSVFDEQGHHFQVAGQAQTDAHGQFRIPVLAGDYLVETQFSRARDRPDEAVLPAAVPIPSIGKQQDLLHIASGEERRIDLRPVVSRTHVVTLPLDDDEDAQPPRVSARSRDGLTFSASNARSQEPGKVRLNLPAGTYALHATRFSRNGMESGESSINVPDGDVIGPTLHLSSIPVIPVETAADTSGSQTSGSRSGSSIPSPMQFNLVLELMESSPASELQFGLRPTQQRDGTAGFAAPPGTYRLHAGLASGWYVRSAFSSGTDLMRETLTVSPGSSPAPITLVVSNQTGSVQGNTILSGSLAACWIYLISSSPNVAGVLTHRSDSHGAFHVTDLPPGTYRVIALPYRHSADLEDATVLDQFSTHVATVSITSGSASTVDLDAVSLEELAR